MCDFFGKQIALEGQQAGDNLTSYKKSFRGAGMVETSDYRIPGSNAVTLSPALAKEIKERFARDRDNRFHIFLIAAGLRRTYLRTSESGTPRTSWRNCSGNWTRRSSNMPLLAP
jgi:hypothetical protein